MGSISTTCLPNSGIMAGMEDSLHTRKKLIIIINLTLISFLKCFLVKAQLSPPLPPHLELSLNPIPLKMVFKSLIYFLIIITIIIIIIIIVVIIILWSSW